MFRTRTLLTAGNTTRTLNRVLGIGETFTQAELRKRYLELCKLKHPDANAGKHKDFLELQKAYHIVTDPALYKRYQSMNSEEQRIFDDMWKVEFGYREVGIEISNYVKKFVDLNDNQQLRIAGKVQSFYERFFAPKREERKIYDKWLSISLDVSESMFG